MKTKTSLSVFAFIAAMALSAQAQTVTTYLINLGPVNATTFNGDPTIFDQANSTPLPSSTILLNPDGSDLDFSLGTATLSVTSPQTYSFVVGGDGTTTQAVVTHSFLYQTGGGTSTFTLSGLPATDTVDFQFLGNSQPFLDDLNLTSGSTPPAAATPGTNTIAQAPDGLTPVFTDSFGTLTGSTSYSGIFTQDGGPGGGEGDVAAAYITVTVPAAVPEPSSNLLISLGLLGLGALVQHRRRQAVA